MEVILPIPNATVAALAQVSAAFNASHAHAIFYRIHIDGHLVVEGFLIAAILFQLSRKSYKPPKKPLTEKVYIDYPRKPCFLFKMPGSDILHCLLGHATLTSPTENEEIASRLTQRFDDTEEKVL
ncbi:hypothetical protein GUJ93_ZPchr0003g17438 [Zizania palustris]|uniref:Uncharacterized protein n=1 Tax=Zizania palustris TaxID=103762 RepID=A0A8J5V5P4_ZIZPA|nr:hypothetical protein GUJ93_ZPchr0003g17438 [Zizania palustris]